MTQRNRNFLIMLGGGFSIGASLGLAVIGFNRSSSVTSNDATEAATSAESPKESQDEKWRSAFELIKRGDYRNAAKVLTVLASAKHRPSLGVLGDLYMSGQGVARNPREAVRLWRLAADQGSNFSRTRLAIAYELGNGVERNLTESFRLARTAAEAGDADAQLLLAKKFAFGVGVAANESEGWRWLYTAANSGNERAKAMVGQLQQRSSASPEERIANAILSSPNATMRDIAVASQILNGRASLGSMYDQGYVAPSYSTAPTRLRSRNSDVLTNSYSGYTAGSGSDYGPAHRSVDEAFRSGSASRRYSGAQAGLPQVGSASPEIHNPASSRAYSDNNGAINPATGEFYAPAGPGYVSTRDGTYYAPAGPNGVVNTRTGEFRVPFEEEPLRLQSDTGFSHRLAR